MNRRSFLVSAGALTARSALGGGLLRGLTKSFESNVKADYLLRIEPCTVEIGNGIQIRTTAYNGQVPGPLLRMREGVLVTIDVTNATSHSDLISPKELTELFLRRIRMQLIANHAFTISGFQPFLFQRSMQSVESGIVSYKARTNPRFSYPCQSSGLEPSVSGIPARRLAVFSTRL
jgi:hypothetical protein